ncbi:MAG: TIGR02996 domain-containing protein [Gemmataceae bacterium]|nr:TIGR02996 domain-containing protein [Gemmataceae bacterium]
MSDGIALLEAIQREPDDDMLRLVYADWLEENDDPERSEFIRIQIEAERHLTGSPEHTRLTDRAVELLSKNASAWANGYEPAIPADAVLSVHKAEGGGEYGIQLLKGRKPEGYSSYSELFSRLSFRRGFVDQIGLTPEEFFSRDPGAVRPSGPLPNLRLQLYHRGTLANVVGRLASAPLLCRFGDICLEGGFGGTTEEGLRLLANEPALLARLAWLRVSEDQVGEPAVLRVLESPSVTRLRDLAIDYTGCTQAVVDLLVRSERFRGMTDLYLSGVIQGGRGLRLFATPGRWPRLRRLNLGCCDLDDLTLRGLMRPGAFPALESLDLHSNPVHCSAVRALLRSGAFPRLRLLGLGGTPLTLGEVQELRDEFGHRVDIWFPVPRRRRREDEETPPGPATPRL